MAVRRPERVFKHTLDMKMLLPANIRAKSVTIATTEDCVAIAKSPRATAFREGGLYDAVWYHNGFTDPESVLNLPLGPTYTMPFTSTQEAMERAASKRKYFYNIVMSRFTGINPKNHHSSRDKWADAHTQFTGALKRQQNLLKRQRGQQQAGGIETVPATRKFCTYAAMTTKWRTPDWISPFPEREAITKEADDCHYQTKTKINQTVYHEVLLDSAFTLSPAGHNYECFRMWEAAEAGSIPVLVANETSPFGGKVNVTGCSLHPDVMKAPFIWATDVHDAWEQMHELFNDTHALNARSREVRAWYNRYMTLTIGRVERLLGSAVKRGRES